MNADQLVDKVVAQFEVSTAKATAWLNERQSRMVAEAEFLMATVDLGTTVADTSNYNLDSTVVDLRVIKITDDGDTTLYRGTTVEDLWNIDASGAEISLDGGLFALDYTSTGVAQIRLYPVPETADLDITGLVAIQPTAITYGATTALQVPLDVHSALLDGVRADAYDEDDRQDMAAKMEQRFAEGIARLRKYKHSRADGSGPTRLRVAGYDHPY